MPGCMAASSGQSGRSSELWGHIFNNKHRVEKENQTWGKWCPSSSTVLCLNPLTSQQASVITPEPTGTIVIHTSTHEPMGTFSLARSHPEGVLMSAGSENRKNLPHVRTDATNVKFVLACAFYVTWDLGGWAGLSSWRAQGSWATIPGERVTP